MKFWELTSIFRDDPMTLEQALQNPRWNTYLGWLRNLPQHVHNQDRQVLDAVLPTELEEHAIQRCKLRFQIRDDFLIRLPGPIAARNSLTATDVYSRFGASAIEEVLEYGSFGPLNKTEGKR